MEKKTESKEAKLVNDIVNIDIIVAANGVGKEVAINLKDQFAESIQKAREYSSIVFDIVLDDDSTEDNIKNTKKLKKEIIHIGKKLEQTKKDLKSDAMAYAQAVQDVYNGIFDVIDPMKKHLDKQINFEKLRQKKIEEELAATRQAELDKIGVELLGIDLGKISDEIWHEQFEGARLRKEDADRQAHAQEEENERIKAESMRIQGEANLAHNRQNEINKAGVIIELDSMNLGTMLETDFREKLDSAIAQKEKADRIAEQERIERQKIANDLKAEQAAREAEKRSGDIERISAWVERFELPELDPDGLSEYSISISNDIAKKFSNFKIWARMQAKSVSRNAA